MALGFKLSCFPQHLLLSYVPTVMLIGMAIIMIVNPPPDFAYFLESLSFHGRLRNGMLSLGLPRRLNIMIWL